LQGAHLKEAERVPRCGGVPRVRLCERALASTLVAATARASGCVCVRDRRSPRALRVQRTSRPHRLGRWEWYKIV